MQLELKTVLGFIAAACTTIAFLPQMIKTLKSRQTRDISLWMYIILTLGLLLWLIYGIMLEELPIILANAVTLVLTVSVLILKIKHG